MGLVHFSDIEGWQQAADRVACIMEDLARAIRNGEVHLRTAAITGGDDDEHVLTVSFK